MSEKKSFKERLLEKGVPEELLNEYSEEELNAMEEEMKTYGLEEEYVIKLLEFRDYLKNFEKYPRKRVGITLAEPVYEILQFFVKDIENPEGEPYPFSYFIEDILVWLLNNPNLFRQFLEDTYLEEEEEEEDGEEAESEES